MFSNKLFKNNDIVGLIQLKRYDPIPGHRYLVSQMTVGLG